MKYKLFSHIVFVVVLIFSFTGQASAFFENKFEKEKEKEAGAVKLLREVQRGNYKIVTTDELKKWIDAKKDIIIIDTMPYEASYKKQHVPRAMQFLFPIPEMVKWDTKETDRKTMEDFKKLLGSNKDKSIIIYCGFVKCTRSHNGAVWAVKLGYKNVYRYPGGIYAYSVLYSNRGRVV